VTNKKRKHSDDHIIPFKVKKLKVDVSNSLNDKYPSGMIWDNINYSCAYDSLFTILFNIWSDDIEVWSLFFQNTNQYLCALSSGFHKYINNQITLEEVRDNVRDLLYRKDVYLFPRGAVSINVADLAAAVSALSKPIAEAELECIDCDNITPTSSELTCFAELQRSSLKIQPSDTVAQVFNRLFSLKSSRRCGECNGNMIKNTYLKDVPQLLMLHIPVSDIKINVKMRIEGKMMKLRGVVYYRDNHYTSRIIKNEGIWFHDGMVTGNGLELEGATLKSVHFNKCKNQNSVLLVYAQQ
jgi:hypothetical protein